MEIRPWLRLICQIGRVVVQGTAFILDFDELLGNRITRVFIRRTRIRFPYAPDLSNNKKQYRVREIHRGIPIHKKRKSMPRRVK